MSLFYRAVGFTGQMVYSYYALSKRWSDKIQSVVEDDAEYDTCYTFKTIEKDGERWSDNTKGISAGAA